MNKNSKRLLISLLILLLSLFISNYTFANTGGEGGSWSGGSNSAGSNNDCTSYGISQGYCLHWVKVDNDQLRDAFSHTYWDAETTSSEDSAYSTCSNTDQNPTGYTVIAGHYNKSTGQLEFGNIFTFNNTYNIDNKTSNYSSFMYETAIGDSTYEDIMHAVMDQYGFSEEDLSIFCPGMVERRFDESYSGSYSSSGTTTVINNNTTDIKGVDSNTDTKSATSSIYLKSKDNTNISTTFSLNHTLRSHIDHVSSPTYIINRDGTDIKNEAIDLSSTETKEVEAYSESYDIPLGTQKIICQTISHTENAYITDHFIERAGIPTLQNTDYNYSGWLNPSTTICAEAKHPYNFKITPSHPSNTNPIIYAGESSRIKGSVTVSKNDDNLPETITPPDTGLRLIQFTLTPSAPDSVDVHGGYSDSDPCSFYRNKLSSYFRDCNDISSSYTELQPGSSKTINGDVIIPDVPIGTKYCTTLGVYRTDSGDGYNLPQTWNITGANCYTIAKKPNFQIWNGGLYTPGNVSSSVSRKYIDSSTTRTVFGSWDEQLVIAGGNITGFASGATLGYGGYDQNKLPGGNSQASKFQDLSPLSINNTESSFGYARISANNTLPDRLLSRLDSSSKDSHITVIHSENDIYTLDHNIINAANTPYKSIKDLPQTIIIAEKGINISKNVSQVDAWLIVKNGFINTCQEFEKGKSSGSDCNTPLIINGPIFAKELKLNRTAGADPGYHSIDPGEIFNLRPDSYLWGYSRAQNFSEAYITYSRELAPRL